MQCVNQHWETIMSSLCLVQQELLKTCSLQLSSYVVVAPSWNTLTFILISTSSGFSSTWKFWMEATFCICDLWGGMISTSRHRWGVKRLWKPSGEGTCPWIRCVNDWTKRGEKIMQHIFGVFQLACSFVEREWHLRFVLAEACVWGWLAWQML